MNQYNFTADLAKFGKLTALVSFTIGTFIFVLHLILMAMFKSAEIVLVGYFYVVIAFIFNTLLLTALLIALIIPNGMTMKILKSIGAMLLNIPVCFVYYAIVMRLLLW